MLLKVNLDVQNISAGPKKIPALTFTLTDTNGVQTGVAANLINDVVGPDPLLAIDGNSTKDLALPFVFPDATVTDFIFSSTQNPAFRIALAIQHNG